jgi:hypothetical protein
MLGILNLTCIYTEHLPIPFTAIGLMEVQRDGLDLTIHIYTNIHA